MGVPILSLMGVNNGCPDLISDLTSSRSYFLPILLPPDLTSSRSYSRVSRSYHLISLPILSLPRMGADLKATFSLPSFYDHFSEEDGITNDELKLEFGKAIADFVS